MDSLVGDHVKDKAETQRFKSAPKSLDCVESVRGFMGSYCAERKDPLCPQIQSLALKANSSQ